MTQSDEGGAATHTLKDSAAQLAEQQKKAGAHQLSGIAGAVHAAADQLGAQLPGAAGYIHGAAERIDHVASELRAIVTCPISPTAFAAWQKISRSPCSVGHCWPDSSSRASC